MKSCHTSPIADRMTSTGHNIKWDHFEILTTRRSDIIDYLFKTTFK